MATTTCPHGFTAGTCLICQTLGGPGARTPERASVEVLSGRRVRPVRSLGVRLATAALMCLVAVVAVVWALTLVWAVLRLIELVAVAVIAAWCGWKVGVRYGRRHPADRG